DMEDVYEDENAMGQSMKAKEINCAYIEVLKNDGVSIDKTIRFYNTFVYAANHGKERIQLWSESRKQYSCTRDGVS
ncbi:hypothetical protein Tco_1060612, partial [Tanacetum coccineum]